MYVHSFSNIAFIVCLQEAKRLEVFCVCWRFSAIEKMDQRICIKFCVKNGIKCSKTSEMLKVTYSESTVI